jgi:hypothetical protein
MSHSNKQQNMIELIAALEGIAGKVRKLEAEAGRALHDADDAATYRQNLEDKTWLLLELPETLEPLLAGIERKKAEDIRGKLKNFARRAEPALQLASPFYMSALLYPEDYREGAKNDLELYIEQLRNEAGLNAAP